MKKKRREIENFKTIDLATPTLTLKQFLCKEVKQKERCGLRTIEYLVLPEYGKGYFTEYRLDGIIIVIGAFKLNQNFKFNCLCNDGLFLSFLMRGGMIIKVDSEKNEKPYEENESFMAFVRNLKTSLKIFGEKPYEEVRIWVSEKFLEKHGVKGGELKNISNKNFIVPVSQNIFSILHSLKKEFGQEIVKRLFLESKVLEIIAMQLYGRKNFSAKNIHSSNPKTIKKLFVLKQFLKDHLNQNFAITELANEIGLSENILKLEFKRVFNCSVNQYFLELKMEKAIFLLQNSDSPIYEIAEAVGYKNATHFSAAFKRFYGETPKTFRLKKVVCP